MAGRPIRPQPQRTELLPTHLASTLPQALELVQPIRVGTCSAKLSGMSLFK